jgi:AcrR family transcriptional regulator
MDAIETRLINATIELGAARPESQSFSVWEIAASCGLSSYPIFSHYGGKEGLVNAAMIWILETSVTRFE